MFAFRKHAMSFFCHANALTAFAAAALILPGTCAAGSGDANTIAETFSRSKDSIVLVGASKGKGQNLGSGFVVHPDGYILTNFHVPSRSRSIYVKFANGRIYKGATVVRSDYDKDLALLKVGTRGLRPLTLGDSDAVVTGQRVFTIGNPLGLEYTVSDGLVSSIRTTDKGKKFLQISVPLSNGSSGGPLFDMDGKVIGVAVGSNTQGQNLNFAVPINYAKPLLKHIAVSADRPAPDSPSRSSNLSGTYLVRQGDTLYSIARKNGTTVNELMKNNGLNGTTIFVGQKLKLSN